MMGSLAGSEGRKAAVLLPLHPSSHSSLFFPRSPLSRRAGLNLARSLCSLLPEF